MLLIINVFSGYGQALLPISAKAGIQKLHVTDKYASYNFKFGKKKYLQSLSVSKNDSTLNFTCTDSANTFIEVIFEKKSEHFFGLGEQYSYTDLTNTKPFVFTQEQGIGRGDKPTTGLTKLFGVSGNEFSSYAPINFFFTTNNHAFIIEGGPLVKYDFTRQGYLSILSYGKSLSIRQLQATNPKQLLTNASQIMGRMPLLPDWAFGTWLGLQGGKDKVEKITDAAIKANAKVTAIWIQDWVGRRKTRFGSQLWWTWQADTAAYPDFKGFCKSMDKKGIKVLGYINSFIANEGELCREAKTKNFLVKNKKGNDYVIKTAGFPAYLVDLTNPAAFEWMKGVIRHNMIEQGLSGWMADYGEWLPADAKLYNGSNALNYHNQYAVDWARLNREAITEAGREGDIVFFTRSGALGSARYSTLFWAGDLMVNWGENDGLHSAVCAIITSGFSGITLNHTDIGGYTTIDNAFLKVKRSDELLKRWIEFAAFTPVYRTHEGLKPASNSQFYDSDSTMEFFASFGRLHSALKDYFKALNQTATSRGIPVVRALLLEYPTDTLTYSIKDEFFLGADLLVAPVLKKGAVWRNVYLPQGDWINAWTGDKLKGKQFMQVNAPIGKPPVFIKAGSDWQQRLEAIFANYK